MRYRSPREVDSAEFYQDDYSEGFTTDCPTDEDLAKLLKSGFVGHEKDYAEYIGALQAAGLRPGDSILDFGCSWGYGSWQLSNAGFRVYSYEISKSRAEYARQKLGCTMVKDPGVLPEKVCCLFSAHVIEHLNDPASLWRIAQRVLGPNGFIACFCPNADPKIEAKNGAARYDSVWGKVHPLAITEEFMRATSMRFGFIPEVAPFGEQLATFARANAPCVRLSAAQ